MTRPRMGHVLLDRTEAIPAWSAGESTAATGVRAEIGPGCPVFVQLASNLYERRRTRHQMTLRDLACLVGRARQVEQTIAWVEMARAQPGLLLTISLLAALDVTLDELTAGIFWNPGEVAGAKEERRPPEERIRGFFSTVPTGVPVFEVPEEAAVAEDQAEAAALIGANVRDARLRRHRGQEGLGLGKGIVGKVERGGEAQLGSLMQMARALEVPPGQIYEGMRWGAVRDLDGIRFEPGRRSDPHANDAAIARLWREDLTVPQIAHRLGLGETAVKMNVRRMRLRGHHLPYRGGRGVLEADAPGGADLAREALLDHAKAPETYRDASEEEVRRHVGATTRLLRERAGLTLWQLGDASMFDVSPLAKAETRGLDLRLTTVVRFAAGLNVPCSALLGGARWDVARHTFQLPATTPAPSPSPAAVVASNVRRIRRAGGLSQRAVAARIGETRRYVDRIERAQAMKSSTRVLALAGALEVEPAVLLEGICDWYVRPLPPALDDGAEAAERRHALLRLWAEGRSIGHIAWELDLSAGQISGAVNRLRAAGMVLPYRNRPTSPERLRTRLHRHRAARPRR